jgi:hypothetical protein
MNAFFSSLVLAVALALDGTAHAFMLPEDTIGKQFWDTLDSRTKPIFLMGFRHGTGPQPGAPETSRGFLVLSASHFPKLIERLDTFYAIKDNKDVCLRLAIQISVMQMSGKPQSEIDDLTKKARDLIRTGY